MHASKQGNVSRETLHNTEIVPRETIRVKQRQKKPLFFVDFLVSYGIIGR
jgi:hypothetical protein